MQKEALVDEILTELYKRLEQKVTIPLSKRKLIVIGPMPTSALKRGEGVYELSEYTSNQIEGEGILITQLSTKMLSHLALASPVTQEEDFILQALLQEKPVYILEEGMEYRKYKKQAHKTLYITLMEYEDKLQKYGVRCISHLDEIEEREVNKPVDSTHEPIKGNRDLDMTYKKLLLESDLIKKHIEGVYTLTITKKCIITPLADDYIRKQHIQIRRI
ncbi:hypothetical protein CS063_11530 [Sporanaerobium hydrogeniformans]|uniref:Uncharacterized protein n=1 Tax=Sporanaerobium hydrogeniformans TaxID=3072179 RepID=A0AC61DB73_9FIRM|nr:hypothetical protein [Sporanaerobium hydrogeniformans]PHV70293.1 hypothetical protein CS063_11530 [Sporanaerobium hydrogeniformans]